MATDKYDFTDKYNTELTPEDEQKFQEWAVKAGRTKDSYDYDMRGAWKDMQGGEQVQADNGHFPDTYKKPNHPTFSDESKYNGTDGYVGGKWEKTKDGKYKFIAPERGAMSAVQLKEYFNKVEPDTELVIPPSRALYGESNAK